MRDITSTDLTRKPVLLSILFLLFLSFVSCEDVQDLVSNIFLLFRVLLGLATPEFRNLSALDIEVNVDLAVMAGQRFTRSLRPYSVAGFDPGGRVSGPSRTSRICGVCPSLPHAALLCRVGEPFHGNLPVRLVHLWLRHRFVQTLPLLAFSWLLRDPGGLAST